MIKRMLQSSNPVDSVIVFTIVSEPPADNSEGECQDIAIAELHLMDLVAPAGEGADSQLLNVSIWDVGGEAVMGTLEIVAGGCSLLSRLTST